MAGGEITVDSTSNYVFAIQVDRFTMTDGSVRVVTHTLNYNSRALLFAEAYVSGGYGEFTATGDGNGLRWMYPAESNFRVTGGRLVFSSVRSALYFFTTDTVLPDVTGDTLVSLYSDGTGKTIWNVSMGVLAQNRVVTSDFLYVEMNGAAGGVAVPQTGDAARPWLWLFLGAVALLLGTGLLLTIGK